MIGIGTVRSVLRELSQDISAARARDPAARRLGGLEILLSYGGVHAILAYRVLHPVELAGVPVLPRFGSNLVRLATGVEIHPAARIGENFFIDHGTGVVIGETAEIGDNVTLYQGVTLGGTGFQQGKRHPTVENNVTVGSGAKLLGPIRIGHGSKIGANTTVIHDVPPRSTVVGNPGHPVRVEGRRVERPDADWIHLPDPVADAMRRLSERIDELDERTRPGRGKGSPAKRADVRELPPRTGPDPTGG